MNRKFVKPWELALLTVLACAVFFAAGKVAIAQSSMQFRTLGVSMFDAYYGDATTYNVARVVASVHNEQTQCVVLEPPLPEGILPWVGLDTPPLWDGRQLSWISIHSGGNCEANLYEVFFTQ